MKFKIVVFFLAIGIIFTACQDTAFFKSTKKIKNSTWSYTDKADFAFTISDTSKAHHLYLHFKHNKNFSYQNLYYKITTKFPDGKSIEQLLSTDFTDKMGRWMGECSGSKCDLKVVLQENARFKFIGEYALSVEQFTRTDSLVGIEAIELLVE